MVVQEGEKMRNPATKIWIYLVLMFVGVALGAAGARGIERSGEDWRWIIVLLVGLGLAPISLMFLIFASLHTRGLAKLRAGEDIVARWSITPSEWEVFRAFDRIRAESGPNLANDLTYDDDRPPLPIEIIVGRKSALIGDSYHVLRKGGIPGMEAVGWLPPPATPECLEFHIIYPRHRSPPVRMTLRFPVPARYRAEGVRVYDYFAPLLPQRQSIALRRPGATIRIALVVAAICASAFAWGLSQAKLVDGGNIAPLIAAVIGAIVGLAALLIALMTWALSRRKV